MVFYLDYSAAGGGKLQEIYVNVGSVYTEPGKDFSLTFARARAAEGSSFTISSLGEVKFSNIVPSGQTVGTNYNWVKAVDLEGKTFSTSKLSIRLQ